MKTFVKMMLPVALFALASAGAIGTKAAKGSDNSKLLTSEWIQSPNASTCLKRTVDCTADNTGVICMDEQQEHQVFRKNTAGQCSVILYKKN
jgi:hypothetical protein